MTDILQTLFTYSHENMIPTYLAELSYHAHILTAERKETELRKLLPPEGDGLLEDFLSDAQYCDSLAQIAAFRAGLSLGLKLARL